MRIYIYLHTSTTTSFLITFLLWFTHPFFCSNSFKLYKYHLYLDSHTLNKLEIHITHFFYDHV